MSKLIKSIVLGSVLAAMVGVTSASAVVVRTTVVRPVGVVVVHPGYQHHYRHQPHYRHHHRYQQHHRYYWRNHHKYRY